MLNKLGGNNVTRNFVKTIFGLAIAIGFLGVGTKAYATQDVDNVKVISVGCYADTCTLTIDRDHPFTRYDPVRQVGTEYCVKRTFAWNKNKYPDFLRLAEKLTIKAG